MTKWAWCWVRSDFSSKFFRGFVKGQGEVLIEIFEMGSEKDCGEKFEGFWESRSVFGMDFNAIHMCVLKQTNNWKIDQSLVFS